MWLLEWEDNVEQEKISEPRKVTMEEEFKKAMQELKGMKAHRTDDIPAMLIKKSGDKGKNKFTET